MITLSLVERDNRGEPTGRTLEQQFATGLGAAIWFDKQRGHNIDRDFEMMDKGVPAIRWKQTA